GFDKYGFCQYSGVEIELRCIDKNNSVLVNCICMVVVKSRVVASVYIHVLNSIFKVGKGNYCIVAVLGFLGSFWILNNLFNLYPKRRFVAVGFKNDVFGIKKVISQIAKTSADSS